MTRKTSVGVLLAVVVAVGVGALVYWQSRERLTFSPDIGEAHSYSLHYQLDLAPERSGARLPVGDMTLDASSRSTVTGRNGETFVVETGLETLVFRNDGREVLNTSDFDNDSGRRGALVRLLKSGLRETVDQRGVARDTEFVDTEAFESIKGEVPADALVQLKQSMAQMELVHGGLPEQPLKAGLQWQAPAVTGNADSVAIPAMTFTVADVGEDAITVNATTQAEGGKAEPVGYIVFERHSGWPLQATLDFSVRTHLMEEPVSAHTRIELNRDDQPSSRADFEYEHFVRTGLLGFPMDLRDEGARRYFLPPYDVKSPDDVLDRVNHELMWFPPEDGEARGLDVPSELLLQNMVEPLRVTALSLLDSDGEPVSDQAAPNERFDLRSHVYSSWSSTGESSAPLLAHPLADDQLQALDRIRMEVEVDVPGKVIEAALKPSDAAVSLGDGVTVAVESWQPNQVVLRVSRPDGFPVLDWAFLAAVPVDGAGTDIPSFQYTSSNTVLERLRASPAFVDREADEDLVVDMVDALRLKSPVARHGDKLITIDAPSPVASVRLLRSPHETRSQTWIARNGSFISSGGPVVGQRTVPEEQVSGHAFPELDMQDAAIDGVARHQLMLKVPGDDPARCEARVEAPDRYRGHTLSLDRRGYGPNLQLTTDNGLLFFYDLSVDVSLRCVTRIEMATLDVDGSDLIERVGPSTVKLTNAASRQFDRIARMSGVRVVPVGRNANGEALQPLEPVEAGQLRFWGEVKTLTLPQVRASESRTLQATFEPLP
ncbi:hypothetical protein [Marinobacter sp. JSM 1782161]|uniref:hypothetical protein n=1 Tax=Marinobacter sp. JSM 1782161 TaxID=2685906 RepID=UPI0014042472|nr:hypothetical protein [Marinobacter sp. JSM 1782161]